jgi:Xaa-Pro aminopeptidase
MNSKIRCLRERLKRLNLEGMIVSNPVNVKYLTNIEEVERSSFNNTQRKHIFNIYDVYRNSK